MDDQLIMDALKAKYKAQILSAKANIDVYITNSVGVAEHPDIIPSIDNQIEILADAYDKLHMVECMSSEIDPDYGDGNDDYK